MTDLNEGENAPAPTVELYEEEAVNTKLAERDSNLKSAGVNFTPQYWMRAYKLEKGDIQEQAAPAAVPGQATPPGVPGVEFAEGSSASAVAETLSALAAGASPVVSFWIRNLRHLVESHRDPKRLQDDLLEVFSDLPTEELTVLMAAAFELVQLQGRERAALEGDHG